MGTMDVSPVENRIANTAGIYRDFTGYICYRGTEAWVENATFELLERLDDEDLEVNYYELTGKPRFISVSHICWLDGIWKDGTWNNGVWKNGIWQDGVWENGVFEDGEWWDGEWRDGIMVNAEVIKHIQWHMGFKLMRDEKANSTGYVNMSGFDLIGFGRFDEK